MNEYEETAHAWFREEMGTITLGDRRLDQRFLTTGAMMAARPSASLSQACQDWAAAKAAYRLFENPKTTAAKVYQPHQARTRERMRGHERVLAIQDTTELNYTHHPSKRGLGPTGTTKQKRQGLLAHTALILSEAGLPLGLASQAIWARSEEIHRKTPEERRRLPIQEKESHKWLQALKQTVDLVPAGVQVVTVGDREADIFEFFNYARTLETDLLVRAGQNRCLLEPEVGRLWESLAQQPVAGPLTVQVPPREDQPAREATVTVRFAPVLLKAPQHLRSRLAPVALYAILVREEHPPAEVAPLEWLLLTTGAGHQLCRCAGALGLVRPPVAHRGVSQGVEIRLPGGAEPAGYSGTVAALSSAV